MPNNHQHYLQKVENQLLSLSQKDFSLPNRLLNQSEVLLQILMLDLFPILPQLLPLYSGRKGGRNHRDPISMLRSMILMCFYRETSVDRWVIRMHMESELVIFSGFEQGEIPGVGTFYDFMDRILDGPFEGRPKGYVPPSSRNKGTKGRFLRNIDLEKEQNKEEEKKMNANPTEKKIESLVKRILPNLGEPLPRNFQTRLSSLLMKAVVVPSANMGILGNPNKLSVSTDGSVLKSQAFRHGRKVCECYERNCDCPRSYSDKDALIGWDSSTKKFFLGYRLHLSSAHHNGLTLPIYISINTANVHDSVQAVEDIVNLHKQLTFSAIGKVLYRIMDAGYDATYIHFLLRKIGQVGIIPFAQSKMNLTSLNSGQALDSDGTPLCLGSARMLRHGFHNSTLTTKYHCPAKLATHRNGKYIRVIRLEQCPHKVLCEPESKMGPIVKIPESENYRHFGPVPRNSPKWKKLYNLRTGVERNNSVLKCTHNLGKRPFRRQHRYLIHAHLVAMYIHTQQWVRHRFGTKRPNTMEEFFQMISSLAKEHHITEV